MRDSYILILSSIVLQESFNSLDEPIKDTVALLNTADLSPVIESTELMRVAEIIKTSNGDNELSENIEVSVTVAQLSSTAPIQVTMSYQ